jgi:L(+)-tartrate dehydratase alpha subunit
MNEIQQVKQTVDTQPIHDGQHVSAAQQMTDFMAKFVVLVGKRLPDDVTAKLLELQAKEQNPMAQMIFESMFANQAMAEKLNRPSCQDTGVIMFFVRVGTKFPLIDDLKIILTDAVLAATERAPLRHNAVETFAEFNTGTNTGTNVPWIDWEIVPHNDMVEIDVYMAGGGCTLPGTAKVLMPSAGYEEIVRYVCEVMTTYGLNACPPLLVGIGIGTSVETAAILSKKALMRPVGSHNANPKAAELEKLLEEGINSIGLGPQGLTGSGSVMGVHIVNAARHPSTIGVAVNVGCWSHRRGTIKINDDLTYELITHRGVAL